MTAERPSAAARYALLLNGSQFACEVLRALRRRGFPPDLLVLPEYPPADARHCALLEEGAPRALSGLAGDIEIAYAPRAHQTRLARRLRAARFDFLLVACWPYLISQAVIDSATRLALNLHPSLLPAYRGPDPLGAQLAAGVTRAGVSLHLLSPEFDAGDILAQCALPLRPGAGGRRALERACARLGSGLFIEALNGYHTGWRPVPQQATLAHGKKR